MTKRFHFDPAKWNTPNSYDANFRVVPDRPGIYLIVLPEVDYSVRKINYKIFYVGSAKSLAVRYRSHEVLRMLGEFYGYVQFYFLEEKDYRAKERELIKLIQPKYNKQWR